MSIEMAEVERCVRESLSRVSCTGVVVQCGDSGQIQLSGEVPSVNERALAIAVARTSKGVRNIVNQISVG